MPVPKAKEEAEEPDLMTVFSETYASFVGFVRETACFIPDETARARLCSGIDRDPALALIVMMQYLTPQIQSEIEQRDEKRLRARAFFFFADISNVIIPEEVIERAYAFGDLFCLLINQLK